MATSAVTLDFSKAVPLSKSNVQLDFSKAVPIEQAQQPGFWENLGHSVGIGTQEQAERQQQLQQHPIQSILEAAGGPAYSVAKSLYQTAKGSAGELGSAVTALREGNPSSAAVHAVTAVPIVGPALNKMADEAPATTPNQSYLSRVASAATPGNVGTALGTAAQVAPMVLGAADQLAPNRAVIPNPSVGKAVAAVGNAAQDAGVGLLNKTVGTLKADFKRGANPSRGYLETGNGPVLTMRGLAEKASDAVTATGEKLGTAYKEADASGKIIPVSEVIDAIKAPLQEAIDVATGPNAPKGLLDDLRYQASTFTPTLEKGFAKGGFTPSEVWDLKKKVAKATSWSDPTQVGIKSVSQQQVGGLSGVLQKWVPDTADLNQNYMDLLKMEGRAEERANTGSRPLTAHIYKALMLGGGAAAGGMEGNALLGMAAGAALDSVPVKTGLAAGLYRGGKALASAGKRLTPPDSVPVVGVAANDLGGNGANYKSGNPQLAPPVTSNNNTQLTVAEKSAALNEALRRKRAQGNRP